MLLIHPIYHNLCDNCEKTLARSEKHSILLDVFEFRSRSAENIRVFLCSLSVKLDILFAFYYLCTQLPIAVAITYEKRLLQIQ